MKSVSKNDTEFILEGLKSGIRVDGRSLMEYRDISFAFGKSDGQVMVQMGNTVIYTSLSTVIVDPFIERAREGMYRINVRLYTKISATIINNRSTHLLFKPRPI